MSRLGPRCSVLCCVPGRCAVPRCFAVVPRGAVVLCAGFFGLFLFGAAACCILPSGTISCPGVLCLLALYFGVFLCAVCSALCVSCCGVLMLAVVCRCALRCVCPGVACCVFPVLSALCSALLPCAVFFCFESCCAPAFGVAVPVWDVVGRPVLSCELLRCRALSWCPAFLSCAPWCCASVWCSAVLSRCLVCLVACVCLLSPHFFKNKKPLQNPLIYISILKKEIELHTTPRTHAGRHQDHVCIAGSRVTLPTQWWRCCPWWRLSKGLTAFFQAPLT